MDCPICAKAGLKDTVLICPQCDSDLSGLHLINVIEKKEVQIEIENQKIKNNLKTVSNQRKIILAVSLLLVVVLSIVFVFYSKKQNKKIVSIQTTMNYKIDSLQFLNSAKDKTIIELEQKTSVSVTNSNSVKYCIRKGDNLWKLAAFFYNNPHEYNKIIEDNKKVLQNGMYVGDTLIIKLKN